MQSLSQDFRLAGKRSTVADLLPHFMESAMRKLSTKRLLHPAWGTALLCTVTLLSCDQTQPLPDPGAVTMRRLSRTEYDRTVRDVFGIEAKVSDRFPADDTGHGFDNLGDVLSLSPLHIQMYQRAAETIAAEVTRADGAPLRQRFSSTELPHSEYVVQRGPDLVILTNTTVIAPVTLPADGTYRIVVEAYGEQAGTEPVQMGIGLDTRPPEVVAVPAISPTPYEVRVSTFSGPHVVQVGLQNDYYNPATKQDRNLAIRAIRIEGPIELDRPNPLRQRLFVCTPPDDDSAGQRACADTILRRVGRLLYRRPLQPDERDSLLALFDQGQSDDELGRFDAGLRLPLTALLLSPHFLFRVEHDADPASTAAHPLSPHELATRLSYFLWSSGPDEVLLDLADAGELTSDEVLTAQVARMLADPRAQALIDNFATQWLSLRLIDQAEPDALQFPSFTPQLRAALSTETRRFVRDFFPLAGSPSRPLPELLTARYTYANAEVARHYGLPAPVATGDDFARLPLDGTTRRGLLTQGSLLTSESYPTRTSPVRRGKWVLEQLLCTPPPPPPPNVIGDFGKPGMGGTLRQRLEQHRAMPVCNSCHSLMDPIGLSLEGFDAIGRSRTHDEGQPVDTTGTLIDGRRFADSAELAALLADDPRLSRCAAEKLFTFAVGRFPALTDPADQARLDALTAAYAEGGSTLHAILVAVIKSDAFRNRRGGDSPAAAESQSSALRVGGRP